MNKKEIHFSYNPLLWVGLALWLGLAIVRNVLAWLGMDMVGQDVLLNQFGFLTENDFAIVSVAIAIGIVVPILEETLFRLWIKVRKTAVVILLFAGMSAYLAAGTAWWVGCVGFALCVAAYLLLSGKPCVRTLVLMLLTSLLFAMGHASSFSTIGFEAVLVMSSLFGLALVTCWLVYNMGFWWACLLHVLNNALWVLLVVLTMPHGTPVAPEPVEFEEAAYSATLRPMSEESIVCEEVNDSTYRITGELPFIAYYMAKQFDPDILVGAYSPRKYLNANTPFGKKHMNWEYVLTFHDTIPYHNAAYLVGDLSRHAPLQIDTTYEPMYLLGIEDQQRLNASTGKYHCTMAEFADMLRIKYDCPVVLEKDTNECFPMSYSDTMFRYPYEVEGLNPILQTLGLRIYKSESEKVQVIQLSYKESKGAAASR